MTNVDSKLVSQLIDGFFKGLIAEYRVKLVLESPYTTVAERQAAWNDMRDARFRFGVQLVFGGVQLADPRPKPYSRRHGARRRSLNYSA
jgi:hypothetical protein